MSIHLIPWPRHPARSDRGRLGKGLARRVLTPSYAFTVRSITAGGEATILTFLRNPYEEPANSREFLDMLSTAAGSPPHDPDVDDAGATISDLPTTMSRRESLLEASKASALPPGPVPSRSEP